MTTVVTTTDASDNVPTVLAVSNPPLPPDTNVALVIPPLQAQASEYDRPADHTAVVYPNYETTMTSGSDLSVAVAVAVAAST